MQFAVGDKVVHQHHGPGWIASIEIREILDGTKTYYVVEIPGQKLTLHVPVGQVGEAGMRLAMSESRFPRVLSLLCSRPSSLPANFRERQEQVSIQLRTGQVMQWAKVIRDLTWHRQRAYLTKVDSDHLRQGRDLLAAEMSLVSGETILDAGKLIDATVTAAVANSHAEAAVES